MKVAIVGLGNVGTNLARAFSGQENIELYLYAKESADAMRLSDRFECNPIKSFNELINATFELVILCVKDDQILDLAKKFTPNQLVAYTSGALELSLIERDKMAVFYPLQTFDKDKVIDFNNLPIFIEANQAKDEKLLVELAQKISQSVKVADSSYRKQLHIAAVFANNFTNYILKEAKTYCAEKNISFDDLLPLIDQTFENIKKGDNKQTGPAARGDKSTIKSHLQELDEAKKDLYLFLSKRIAEKNGKEL